MLQKLTQPYFVMGLVGAIKIILQAFNISIPDAELNDFFNGIAALVTIIGIVKDHDTQPKVVVQQPQVQQPQQPTIPPQA